MKVNRTELAAKIVGMAIVFGIALFLPAGTMLWAAGWLFWGLFILGTVLLTAWLARANEDLLEERLTGLRRKDQKLWDKILLSVTAVFFFSWLPFIALDAVRFKWSHVPVIVQVLGGALSIGAWLLFYICFRENSYLSPAVRIQTDRGQQVISTGPYSLVRHPFYAAFGVFTIGTSLMLGSIWGLIGAGLLIGMVAVRAVLEEKVLMTELAGYTDYVRQVKYRFVPGVW